MDRSRPDLREYELRSALQDERLWSAYRRGQHRAHIETALGRVDVRGVTGGRASPASVNDEAPPVVIPMNLRVSGGGRELWNYSITNTADCAG